jgi:adenosylcobinamide-GDP ribazoletransferase
LFLIFLVGPDIALLYDCFCFSTRAFHEDGFADVCDGFGGGWTKEKS